MSATPPLSLTQYFSSTAVNLILYNMVVYYISLLQQQAVTWDVFFQLSSNNYSKSTMFRKKYQVKKFILCKIFSLMDLKPVQNKNANHYTQYT